MALIAKRIGWEDHPEARRREYVIRLVANSPADIPGITAADVWNSVPLALMRADEVGTNAKMATGCRDRKGRMVHVGDIVVYNNQGPHTMKDYWNPEYRVIFDPPCFTLEHIGGGKDGGNHFFKLKHGGANGNLEVVTE